MLLTLLKIIAVQLQPEDGWSWRNDCYGDEWRNAKQLLLSFQIIQML